MNPTLLSLEPFSVNDIINNGVSQSDASVKTVVPEQIKEKAAESRVGQEEEKSGDSQAV